ncbi:MAG: hypothetical protein KKG75_00770 [Nanoarchaeota archaeon]|nr:hypothetical protein [Nanoarchaeota archaeon]
MDTNRKKINKLKVFSILITTTFVFALGIFFGHMINTSQLNNIMEFQQDLRTQTLSLELQYALASQELCVGTNWNLVGNELYNMGEMLANMESSLGKLDEDVLKLKEYYSLLEVKHWLFLKNVKEKCKSNTPIILYFYSNLGDCDDCEKQGYILTYLKKKNPELNIFSFDINTDNIAIEGLKDLFGLKGKNLPLLIVDDTVLEEFTGLEELNKLIS